MRTAMLQFLGLRDEIVLTSLLQASWSILYRLVPSNNFTAIAREECRSWETSFGTAVILGIILSAIDPS